MRTRARGGWILWSLAIGLSSLASGCGELGQGPKAPLAPKRGFPSTRMDPEVFLDEPGNFRIRLPVKPVVTHQNQATPIGFQFLHSFVSTKPDKSIYSVIYAEFPDEFVRSKGTDAILDGGMRGMVASGQWSVTSQEPITHGPHPGRDVYFEVRTASTPEKGIGRARAFVIGNRLYQLVIIGPESSYRPDDAQARFDSFMLLRKVPVLAASAPVATAPAGGPPAAGSKPIAQLDDPGPDPSHPAEVAIDAGDVPGGLVDRPEPERPDDREAYREVAPKGGVLVGVRVGYIDAFGGSKVGSILPIFQLGHSYIEGKQHGAPVETSVALVAQPGFAVGAINTRTGLLLDAFQVVFMKFKDGRLDPADSYLSPWLGDPRGGNPSSVSGDGKLVSGIHGRSNGREINALGLVIHE